VVQKVTPENSVRIKTKMDVSGSAIDTGLNAKPRRNKQEERGKTKANTVTKVDGSVLQTNTDTLTKVDGSV
jgi:hypothetical protein